MRSNLKRESQESMILCPFYLIIMEYCLALNSFSSFKANCKWSQKIDLCIERVSVFLFIGSSHFQPSVCQCLHIYVHSHSHLLVIQSCITLSLFVLFTHCHCDGWEFKKWSPLYAWSKICQSSGVLNPTCIFQSCLVSIEAE